MPTPPPLLDLKQLRVLPLAERKSLTRIEEILVEPSDPAPACDATIQATVADCAQRIHAALKRNAGVMLIYGAHLIKNGGQLLLNQMLERG